MFFREILHHTPVNTPLIGVWDLDYSETNFQDKDAFEDFERMFILEVAKAGHFFQVIHECANLSLFSGIPAKIKPSLPLPTPKLDKSKNYLCFIYSEGDNLSWQLRNRPLLWKDPSRGKIPIGWQSTPALYEITPHMAKYYHETSTFKDEFVLSISGAGYTMPSALGSNRRDYGDKPLNDFLALTGKCLKKLGMHCATLLDYNEDGSYFARKTIAQKFAQAIPELKGLFCDYPTMFGKIRRDVEPYLVDGLAVFNVGTGSCSSVKDYVEAIKTLTKAKPTPNFIYVFVSGWNIYPRDRGEIMRRLGNLYIPLLPTVFTELFKLAQG